MITSAGVSASATCKLLLRIRLIARSVLFRSAICTPTTFSTAFPAIATTTSPANASDMPSAGHRRLQRLDEPVGDERRADPGHRQHAPAPAAAARACSTGLLRPGWPPARLASEKGMLAANTMSSTTATIRLRSRGVPTSGAPGAVASVGIASAATLNTSSVEIIRVCCGAELLRRRASARPGRRPAPARAGCSPGSSRSAPPAPPPPARPAARRWR